LTGREAACYKHRDFAARRQALPRDRGRSTIGAFPRSPAMLNAYIPIFLFVLIAIGFAIFTLMFSRLIHAEKRGTVKLEPYECGIEPLTDARDRYSVRYYLVAMLFVIFDVETVFMFPWAVIMDRLLLFGLIEMVVFLFILVVGYVYAWRKGALEWA
jgi:NADH-quinone oxidoreductase subunit A